MASDAESDLDLVLLDAAGYAGRLLSRHLAERTAGLPAGDPERFALGFGGRDPAKRGALREEFAATDPIARDLPLLVGDSHDPTSLEPIVRKTRAMATNVGRYAHHGKRSLPRPSTRLAADLWLVSSTACAAGTPIRSRATIS